MNEDNEKKAQAKVESMLEMLRNSYEMYEISKDDTREQCKKKVDKAGNRIYSDEKIADNIALIETMQKDIKAKYLALGGKEEDLISRRKRKKNERDAIKKKIEEEEKRDAMLEYIKRMSGKTDVKPEEKQEVKDEKAPNVSHMEEVINAYAAQQRKSTTDEVPAFRKDYNASANKVNYDTVPLPSKGECYKNKISEIMVSHLCAYDENMILSPNLYKNGTFLDHILKNKIVDNIDADDLVQGDRDAIIIWLRASGYGNDYPVDMIDDNGKTYRTHVDLSTLKFKKFNLKGDENGYFDFTLPISKDNIKFRFLTNRDSKQLEKMRKEDDDAIKINDFKKSLEDIRDSIEENNLVSTAQYEKVNEYLDKVEAEMTEVFQNNQESLFSHDLTNRLILSTMSINGNTDRSYIAEYIIKMNIRDAIEYRKYIIENEPGIDYNIKVEKPSSLGGGYVETFLQLDQFIFITGLQ